MADVKITQLPNAGSLTGSEQVPVVQAGVTVKTTTYDISLLNPGIIGPPGPAGPAGPAGPPGPTNDHVLSGGPGPTVAYVPGDGGSLLTSGGTDSSGYAIGTTGSGTGFPGVLLQVTFAAPWTTPPRITLSPGDQSTAGLQFWMNYSDMLATGFTVSLAAAPPGSGFTFYWHAIGDPN